MYALAIGSFIIDQLIVAYISRFPEYISRGERWFSLVEQPGSSLGALFLMIILLKKYPLAAWGLVLGGAVSNLVTILSRGGAVDYLDLGSISTNFADICIVVGLTTVALRLVKSRELR